MRGGRAALVVVLGIVVLLVAGCGSGGDGASDADVGRATTVSHKFGTTTIEGTPQRVVAASSQWVDALLELGIQPVAYLSAGDSGDDRGLYPWEQGMSTDAVELDRAAMRSAGAALPAEQIAALEPDLILGAWQIADQSMFDRLAALAPTIGPLGDAQVDSWQDQLTVLGRVFGVEDRAAQIVQESNDAVSSLASRLPGLHGRTAVLAQFLVDAQQIVVVADPDDGASAVFESLGLSLPAPLVAEAGATGGRLTLSPERVDALDADLLVMLPNGGTEADLLALPGFAQLPSVEQGGLAVVDYPTVVGFNTPSSSSIAYSLERITPQLEKLGAA
ncbi:ABC transporter substrate-binding protein [Rhodococcus sp. HNM0569]|uniref:ABC transporter substrate-binding protein n=1 Tax=Rhodococcus sp. HNM0569 TaxID=2716340 RepID=UPI00146B0594|nr:ABC transporter substrate-binding protein [Rhodococcus sp. HNM0569]NLU82456.1 ABC transporter substrate-binding protein [Rhodococcus sp. HNM0569]